VNRPYTTDCLDVASRPPCARSVVKPDARPKTAEVGVSEVVVRLALICNKVACRCRGCRAYREQRGGQGSRGGGDQHGRQPGGVEGEQVGGEFADPGVLAGAHAVFHPGVHPVGGVDAGRVSAPAAQPGGQVGDPQAVAPAVAGFEQGELGTGAGRSRQAKVRIDAGQRSSWSPAGPGPSYMSRTTP